MLDLLGLRRSSDQALHHAFGAATRSDDDRLGPQNYFAAGAPHRNRLDALAGQLRFGMSAENPVVMALAQHLDHAAFRNARVRQCHRSQTGWHSEISGQGGGGQALESRHAGGRHHHPFVGQLDSALRQVRLHDFG